MSIYRNAYQIRLKGVLETDHELLSFYLGDELWDQMVTGYIAYAPSKYPSLRQFGDRLPEFLANTLPFNQHPVIAEIAFFERRLIDSFDAADAPRYQLEHLQAIPEDAWPSMSLKFHPSVQALSFHWNTVLIWQRLKAEQPPVQAIEQDSDWLVWRNAERLTEFRSIDQIEVELIRFAQAGHDFSEICEKSLDYFDESEALNNLVPYLMAWINQGLVSMISWT